ncbi:MAG: chemotaxis protein CheB [Undibacterium sp.]|nr:chemotaxis protein CheB [Opitutaceae bacterium]
MIGHEIIVVGASAGGVDAVPRLIESLPADLPASIFVVLHIPALGPDLLAEIVGRRAALKVSNGVDGEKILPGHVYLAPPDFHLQLEAGRVRLTRGPRENRHRPAIDALFRSAAEAYGPRVTGVVLTGYLDDGTAGLNSVKTHGGVAVVQDPKEAAAAGMPASALRNVEVDYCVPLAEIGPLLIRLATAQTGAKPKAKKVPSPAEKRQMSPKEMAQKFGPPTGFICPECNGPLWETKTGRSLQFRCHVGHAYSPDSLMADHADGLERALWSAVRTFDEQAALLRRLGERRFHSQAYGSDLELRAAKFEGDAEAIRKLLQAKR